MGDRRSNDPRRGLGVRVEGSPRDVVPDASGHVHFGSGGMSVAPCSYWNLAHHRRPRPLGRGSTGNVQDRIYSLRIEDVWPTKLAVRADPTRPLHHAFIEPATALRLKDFEEELAATQPRWVQAWP